MFGIHRCRPYPVQMNAKESNLSGIAQRFRGFLPVVVDVETAGFDAQRHALLEIAAIIIRMTPDGHLEPSAPLACHVLPFVGAEIDPRALAFNRIDPDHPFRDAISEQDALQRVLLPIRKAVKATGCNRAILVGHNAHFDLGFVKAAVERTGFKENPFHAFSVFDTVTLGGLVFGQTVLARTAMAAGLYWQHSAAHSAVYDAEQTARLFCTIVNRWHDLDPVHFWNANADESRFTENAE
ncbi:ribonuclease T [Chromatium okenii]|nr:ribonuclease T [Chromatium okenii]